MYIPGSSAERYLRAMLIAGMLLAAWHPSWSAGAADSSSAPGHKHDTTRAAAQACAGDNGGITLSAGFCATVFADNVGHARHLVVAPNGVVYVNTWSGRYYGNDTPPAGGFLVTLRDTNGDGRADVNIRFGDSVQSGSAGGTGIALYHGALYAEANDRIVRYFVGSEPQSQGYPRVTASAPLTLAGGRCGEPCQAASLSACCP